MNNYGLLLSLMLFFGCENCATNKMDNPILMINNCWENIKVNLPKNAVFYYAKVAPDEENSMGNEQWMLDHQGKVYLAENEGGTPYGESPFTVFNTSFQNEILAEIPPEAMIRLKERLDQMDVFNLPRFVPTPDELVVDGGYSLFLFLGFAEQPKCVELAPGVPLGRELPEYFMDLITPYLKKD